MTRISITAEHNGRTIDITIEQEIAPVEAPLFDAELVEKVWTDDGSLNLAEHLVQAAARAAQTALR